MSPSRLTAIVAAAFAAATALVSLPAPAAQAGSGDNGGEGGYSVAVNVVVTSTGKGDPIPSGGITISVPPECWWVPSPGTFAGWENVDPEKPKKVDEWYHELVTSHKGSFSAARLFLPSKAEFRDAMRRNAAGEDVTWYILRSQEGVNCADEGFTRTTGTLPWGWYHEGESNTAWLNYLAVTGSPPEPLVEVEDMVDSLWDAASQALTAPEIARSPELGGTDGATVVNLPTWLWVENVQEALAGDGEIHLEASIPGTPVRATLDAETTGLKVRSPVNSVDCSVDQAIQPFAVGVDESAGCVTSFERPNAAGWPVTSTIEWTASWEGVDHNGPNGGDLAAQSHSTTSVVPVVEAGATVTEVD